MGERSRFSRMTALGLLVGVGQLAHRLVFRAAWSSNRKRAPRSSSPCWSSISEKSTLRALTRGGVPVLNRRRGRPSARRLSVSGLGGVQCRRGRSPGRTSPTMVRPLRIGAGGQNGGPHVVDRPRWQVTTGGRRRPPSVRPPPPPPAAAVRFGLALQGVLHHVLVLPAGPPGPGGTRRRGPCPGSAAGTGCSMCVGGPGHLAPQGVQLPDQVALAGAADGGVAGHVAHRVQVDGKAPRSRSPSRAAARAASMPGVAGADDGDIKLSRSKSSPWSFLNCRFYPCVRVMHRHLRPVEQTEGPLGPELPSPRETNTSPRSPLAAVIKTAGDRRGSRFRLVSTSPSVKGRRTDAAVAVAARGSGPLPRRQYCRGKAVVAVGQQQPEGVASMLGIQLRPPAPPE